MASVYEVADKYIEEYLELDPVFASHIGVEGHDGEMTDFSPAGIAKRAEFRSRFRRTMAATNVGNDRDRRAHDFFVDRLTCAADEYETGDDFRNLSVLDSGAQSIRRSFDLLERDTRDQWSVVAQRMALVPKALAGVIETLRDGNRRGLSASRRQAVACARQCRIWSGTVSNSQRFFGGLYDEYISRTGGYRKVTDALFKAAGAADIAFAEMATYLVDEYAPAAPDRDAVGPERYAVAMRHWLGADEDPLVLYDWGWDELHGLDAEIAAVCKQIAPGLSLREVIEGLDDDHDRCIHGEAALVDWLQSLVNRTIGLLDGKHFDIPSPLQRVDVRIAPRGGGLWQYYTGPSEDLRRCGTYWYPTDGRNRFPIWAEISTAYHESVPGHHLQIGYAKYMQDELSRFQRHSSVDGHEEGWALYAERLMDELGLLDRPEYRLDMLLKSFFRAARVVVDIGLHLQLSIPAGERFHAGETWTPELAKAFMLAGGNGTPDVIAGEIDRYLGTPAQAISYKVGEKVWREGRAAAKQRQGADFDLKTFHTAALSLGPLGLDQLTAELAKL